jgi:4,5-dihydroxyphthalate decarboxylase
MADLELSLALTPYDRVAALLSGELQPQSIALRYHNVPLSEIWSRQLKDSFFDVSEMSFSFFLRARAHGWGYRMLPVFHNRTFTYTRILTRAASGIRPDHPEDLNGKRVGLTEYGMSAAVWTRGILQGEYGLRLQAVEWFQERPETFIPGMTSGFTPPPGVKLLQAPTNLATMLLQGKLDAAFTLGSSSLMGPLAGELADPNNFRPLFQDAQKEAIRYYTKSRIYPPHHVTVVRESVLQRHPWVAQSLMEAFAKAKKLALERLYGHSSSLLVFGGQWLEQQRAIFGDDPYPDGLPANARALDLFQTFSLEQGLTARKQPFAELFPAELLSGVEHATPASPPPS